MVHISEVIREMGLASRQADDELRAAAAPPERAEARLGLPLQPGVRVLDLVTGQQGVVDAGTRANLIVPPAER